MLPFTDVLNIEFKFYINLNTNKLQDNLIRMGHIGSSLVIYIIDVDGLRIKEIAEHSLDAWEPCEMRVFRVIGGVRSCPSCGQTKL